MFHIQKNHIKTEHYVCSRDCFCKLVFQHIIDYGKNTKHSATSWVDHSSVVFVRKYIVLLAKKHRFEGLNNKGMKLMALHFNI